MTRVLISSLVGAIILFFFQAASWMVLDTHTDSFKYLPEQDEVMEVLNKHLEEGYYYMPYFDVNTTSQEEQQAFNEANTGKPWVMLQYHEKMEMSMAKNMGFGFLSCFFICLIISIVLVNVNADGFGVRMFFVLLLASLVVVGGPLYDANWFKTPGHFLSGQLIDIIVGYGLAGLWMAWWTGRK